MRKVTIHKTLTLFIAAVWLINGLYCKVLNLVPRHREIIGHLLSHQYAALLTLLIGFFEIMMVIWIVSNVNNRLNAIVQILIVAAMNIIECVAVPHLLLWGRFNGFFAFLFILLIYYNEFYFNSKPVLNK